MNYYEFLCLIICVDFDIYALLCTRFESMHFNGGEMDMKTLVNQPEFDDGVM